MFPVNFAKSLRTHFYRMPPVAAVFLKKCFFLETNETNVGHIHSMFFSLAADEAFFYIYIYICFFYCTMSYKDLTAKQWDLACLPIYHSNCYKS